LGVQHAQSWINVQYSRIRAMVRLRHVLGALPR